MDYQEWGYYRGGVGHMIRYYLSRPRKPTEQSASSASRKAWDACDAAFRTLTDTEQSIVRTYYLHDTSRTDISPMQYVSGLYAVPLRDVKNAVSKMIRTVAVNRGLADR